MNEIKVTEVGQYLHVKFPFALKDAFRELFKTAEWNPTVKVWVIKKNKINLNKLEVFKDKTASACQQLAQLDEIEITEAEISRLEVKLKELENTLSSAIADKPALLERTSKLDELKKLYADKRAEAQKAIEEKEAAQNEVKSRIDEILKPYDAQSVISKLIRARNKSDKSAFLDAQDELTRIYDDVVKSCGIELMALYKLSAINMLRKDQSPSDIASHLYTNINYVSQEQ
jgi:DNA repair exonuclease SbcCD ATPase subunit